MKCYGRRALGTRHFKFLCAFACDLYHRCSGWLRLVVISRPSSVSSAQTRVSCTFSALSLVQKKEFCFCSHDLYALVNVMSCIHQTYSHGQPRNRTLSPWTSLIVFFYFFECVCESVFELFFSSGMLHCTVLLLLLRLLHQLCKRAIHTHHTRKLERVNVTN